MDNESIDEMRKQIQQSLIEAKQQQLRDEFGMQFDHMDSRLSREGQNEWLEKQPLYGNQGEPISLAEFAPKLEMVWAHLPVETRAFVEQITTRVADDEGMVTAVVTWQLGNEQKQVESFFRLQPSPYFGWDVVQTSLLDDLIAVLY